MSLSLCGNYNILYFSDYVNLATGIPVHLLTEAAISFSVTIAFNNVLLYCYYLSYYYNLPIVSFKSGMTPYLRSLASYTYFLLSNNSNLSSVVLSFSFNTDNLSINYLSL